MNIFRISTLGSTRCGITLVEVLVTIGVIGILSALLFPAIQQGRESARLNVCKYNLHQIGIAMQNFHDAEKQFPNLAIPWVDLLPYLEQKSLHSQLAPPNFKVSHGLTSPQVYLCPSDPEAKSSDMRLSYTVNNGSRIRPPNGLISQFGPSRLQDVTDGLSSTAMVSERLVTLSTQEAYQSMAVGSPKRSIWMTPREYFPGEESLFCEDARSIKNFSVIELGPKPAIDILLYTMGVSYNHIGTPNLPWFYNGDNPLAEGLRPPGSMHRNGVNLLMCDGSVHFISDQIDDQVWRAIGSRNGNEPVPLLP